MVHGSWFRVWYSHLAVQNLSEWIEWFVEHTERRQPIIATPKPRARVQKLTEGVVCEARGEGAAHHGTVHGMLEEFKGTVDAHRLDVVPVLYGGADLD